MIESRYENFLGTDQVHHAMGNHAMRNHVRRGPSVPSMNDVFCFYLGHYHYYHLVLAAIVGEKRQQLTLEHIQFLLA